MANEIQFWRDNSYAYFILIRRPGDRTVWYPAGSVFEAFGGGVSRNLSDYGIEATHDGEDNDLLFYASFPSGPSAGKYVIEVYHQSGADPADTDEWDGSFEFLWDGEAEVDPLIQDKAAKIRANKASQDKSTGTVTIRNNSDTDDEFEMTLTDDGSTITREVSTAS